MGEYGYDGTANFINPALGPDGTLYCAYSDVVDTTGAGGDVSLFKHSIMVMFSEDNGTTWQGPVSVLDNWEGRDPNGMAKHATENLHIVYRTTPGVWGSNMDDYFSYLGVPTDSVKANAPTNV